MSTDKIHIYEENTQIIWGLIAIVSIGIATYTLFNAFMAVSWQWAGYKQLLSMALFILGFYGIIKISTPLYHFVLKVTDSTLNIEIWREGDEPLDIKSLSLRAIDELRVAPHTPRAPDEALFDFSTSYHLLYRLRDDTEFRRLIKLQDASFTLKVEDIKKIVEFLSSHNSEITIPDTSRFHLNEPVKPFQNNR